MAVKFLISIIAVPIAVIICFIVVISCLVGVTFGLLIGVPSMVLGSAFGIKGDGGVNDFVSRCFKGAVDGPAKILAQVMGNIWD
ncbi:hypothetical protein [Streptomyces fractus]|uniref:hypothetical protein n=1 Tax=Streptomyces fractus TaxID=641806 RepID=UPI003CE941CC